MHKTWMHAVKQLLATSVKADHCSKWRNLSCGVWQ